MYVCGHRPVGCQWAVFACVCSCAGVFHVLPSQLYLISQFPPLPLFKTACTDTCFLPLFLPYSPPPIATRLSPLSVVLSPRQREERELEEADVRRVYGSIAQTFADKVADKALSTSPPLLSAAQVETTLRPALDKLARKASVAVTEQELRPVLEKMAGKIGHKVWYVTEKGDLEVVPLVLEAEQREMDEMRALIDGRNYTGALSIYQGRYKRFPRNPPPPRQTSLAFEALHAAGLVNQTVVLYNYWYAAKNQGGRVLEPVSLYWVTRSLLEHANRLDMAVDVFRAHTRFDCLPSGPTLLLLLQACLDRNLYELASELVEATHLGGFALPASLGNALVEGLLDQGCLDLADRAVSILLTRRLPLDVRVGTYFKNYMVKNGRMHLAYLHLTDPRLTHSRFRASANGYNMLLWRMCRVFMKTREAALPPSDPIQTSSTAASSSSSSAPLTSKNELRGLTLRIARVVAMMNRFGYRVTPQSGAMLQDVAAATGEFGFFQVLEKKLKEIEKEGGVEEPDFGLK